jgi:MerR family transcriptional regulator, heat shock protein HspR
MVAATVFIAPLIHECKSSTEEIAAVSTSDPDRSKGVYGISTAAELVGTGLQNLRLYERKGLLSPNRTSGGTRRYSEDDLARLRRIGQLLTSGLNLAGIAMVLDLELDNARLRARLRTARRQAAQDSDDEPR